MAAAAENWDLDGRSVHVTHLDKPYWPQAGAGAGAGAGFTKGDMLRYYAQVAPTLLPYLRERPVTVRVYPHGVRGRSYYQRARSPRAPAWLRSATYHPKTTGGAVRLLLVDDSAGLLWLANAGGIEFHLWGSHLPDLSVPDQAIFDLDPGDEAVFADVSRAALWLHDALERRRISGYAKTSGGRGLHVFVPLAASAGYTFDDVRGWVRRLAEQLATTHPEAIAVVGGSTPTHQGSRVTIDYAQNSLGRNTAAPYTLRAHPTAPTVSAPLTWDEVAAGGLDPADYTPPVVLERIRRLGDLFAPVLTKGQRLDL